VDDSRIALMMKILNIINLMEIASPSLGMLFGLLYLGGGVDSVRGIAMVFYFLWSFMMPLLLFAYAIISRKLSIRKRMHVWLNRTLLILWIWWVVLAIFIVR
jgi:hypothetical protein